MANILYSLTLNGEPVKGSFILDGSVRSTPWSGGLGAGVHQLQMLESEVNDELYDFEYWKENGITVPTMVFDLKSVNVKTNPVKGVLVEVDGGFEPSDFVVVTNLNDSVVLKAPQKA